LSSIADNVTGSEKMGDKLTSQEVRIKAFELAISMLDPVENINEKQGIEVIEHYFPLTHAIYEFLNDRKIFDELCRKRGLSLPA
jgi:hypothetical protein